MPKFCMFFISLFISSAVFAGSAYAWELDPAKSLVSFVSIKKGNIGESHAFNDVTGSIKDGIATVTIRPDSVDSRVPIRDERMREFLFETKAFPTIEVSADVKALLASAEGGKPQLIQVSTKLSMHGVESNEMMEVYLTKNGKSLSVVSARPVLIRAKTYGMVEGILKLASLVNNLAIAESVPVSFALTFTE